MYTIPAELINNFIRYLQDQLAKLVTEMHMTEFAATDRSQLTKLVKHLDQTSHDVISLAVYRINDKDADLELVFKEFDQFRNNVHELILSGQTDPQLIETLKKANEMIEELRLKKGN